MIAMLNTVPHMIDLSSQKNTASTELPGAVTQQHPTPRETYVHCFALTCGVKDA